MRCCHLGASPPHALNLQPLVFQVELSLQQVHDLVRDFALVRNRTTASRWASMTCRTSAWKASEHLEPIPDRLRLWGTGSGSSGEAVRERGRPPRPLLVGHGASPERWSGVWFLQSAPTRQSHHSLRCQTSALAPSADPTARERRPRPSIPHETIRRGCIRISARGASTASARPRTSMPRGRQGSVLTRSSITIAARPLR